MYILIVETQFHRCLRQIEVVEYKCENGYGYGYPDGYPDILYPILLHHCSYKVQTLNKSVWALICSGKEKYNYNFAI